MSDRPAMPIREVRASFTDTTIRVYQAFSHEIADQAVASQTFRGPFKRDRMTWIKPSFMWMMYRSGWGSKPDQECVLGVDILRSGFDWALANSCASSFDSKCHADVESWRTTLRTTHVRVQWDPERSLQLTMLPYRTIQVGLKGEAVDAYVDRWVVKIEDLTATAKELEAAVTHGAIEDARTLLPVERRYPLTDVVARLLGSSEI